MKLSNGAVKAAEVIIETIKAADNEAAESPWWMIIDPQQISSLDIHNIASMITGPFFSREDAEGHLKDCRYGFGKHAKVYCHSGYWCSTVIKEIMVMAWVSLVLFLRVTIRLIWVKPPAPS